MTDLSEPHGGDACELGCSTKDRTRFQRVLADCVRDQQIDLQGNVLLIGGSYDDALILQGVGFRRMTLTNLQQVGEVTLPAMAGVELDTLYLDAEAMNLADGSFDLVLAHEVLHHCSSPHRALLEMLRVSRRNVIILEPNDSLLMKLLVKLRFSFPFELPAVVHNNFVAGGLRNTCVPNYIYRWSPRDIYQAVASSIPGWEFTLHLRRYWDFNVDKDELARRTETRIGAITKIVGPGLFLACLHGFQAVVNRLPWFGSQGNKFFGCITRHDRLKPWLMREDGRIVFNRGYGKH